MTALRTAALQRRAVISVGVAALTALVIAVAVWSAGPQATPGSGDPAAFGTVAVPPSSATGMSSEPPSGGLDGPWGSLDLPPYTPVATLVATNNDRDRVATSTAFTLASLGARSAGDLARAIEVQPSIGLEVQPGTEAGTATLRPTAPLDPGQLYRFTLRTPDGAIAGSWAFQAAAPLSVVTTVPRDGAINVPAKTGIELTFDQDGALDVAAYFSIQPAVKGTFEQHGRTVVFVPEDLEPATLYTVTVKRGVGLEGSAQILEADVRIRFETAPTPPATGDSPERPAVWFGFARSMIEVPPSERATLAVSISASTPALARRPFAVEVYRLPSETAGITAVRRLSEAPAWATWSRAGLVSRSGLTRVDTFTARPEPLGEGGDFAFALSRPLDPGWYLVDIPRPGRSAQTVLQVTDVGAYSAVARDRLLVWANDIATGTSLVGATVETAGGDTLGQTDAGGLLVTKTPAAIRLAASGDDATRATQVFAIRTTDGRSLIVPLANGGSGRGYLSDVTGYVDEGRQAEDYWRYVATDRGIYRRTDTVNVWGFVRPRDGVPAPTGLELTLRDDVPITTVSVSPDRTGAFAASLPITDLPYGEYTVELTAGDVYLGSVWVAVREIRKPAYAISLTTDRHVVVAGDPVTLTARAVFFDGTPVPGVSLAVDMFGTRRTATTDASGTATVTASPGDSGWISVRPARPEEAEISASTSVWVFPSRVMIEAQATIDGGQIELTGSLNEVAIERLEAAWASNPWSNDPTGPPVRDGQITVEIIERVPVRIRTRQIYDFINKQVVDTYDYRWDEVARSTRSLTSGADGAFQLQHVATPGRTYEIALSAPDAAGRPARTWVTAQERQEANTDGVVPYLESGECNGHEWWQYDIGDAVCLQMVNRAGLLPTGDGNRYLFFSARRGLEEVVVQESPVYSSTFGAADVPNRDIWGVRFSGTTFTPVEQPYTARFDAERRRLTVKITPDQERYAPGETVELDVQTTDLTGAPTSAAVVLRAVDEKLFAIGAAYDQDPLWDLYGANVGSWLLWTHASHPVPFARTFQGGDTSGGGGDDGRSEFADSLLFRKVTTDVAGRARVSFKLSDDLTSWRVSATATTAVPEAGVGSVLVPVGLPFFVDATLAPEYLAGERPTLRLRAYGSDLRPGDQVTYTVSPKSLAMSAATIRGPAFGGVDVPLPALSIGEHAVTISGSVGRGSTTLSDRLTRRFDVIGSRFAGTRTTYAALTSGLRPEGGAGWTTYVFSDAGRGRYLPLLQSLGWSGGARVDQALAATIARDLLVDEFGVDRDSLPAGTFEPGRYQLESNGVALLPYSSPDLALTARIALLAGDRFDRGALASALWQVVDDPASTRERRIVGLAGLAGLGEPVLADLRLAAADSSLTIRERLYLALGLANLGDDATAIAIERELLDRYGERRGPSIRLRVGASLDDTIEATSLLALLAAQLSEPFAPELQSYVDGNRAVDELFNLQQVSFVSRFLARAPSTSAQFAYSLNGERSVVDLGPGEGFSLRLTEAQRRTLTLEPLDGSVGLATSWQAPLDPGTIASDPDLTIARTVLPSGDIPSTTLVEVRLTATFGPRAVSGCYAVTDLVPSGMAPIARLQVWPGYESSDRAEDFVEPFDISAQRVSFCVEPRKAGQSVRMRYFARVVSPGEYVWEPAVIQSTAAAESINLTATGRVTVR